MLKKMEAQDKEKLFSLLKFAIWDMEEDVTVDWLLYEELKKHTIDLLPVRILPELDMPDELRQTWINSAYTRVAYNVNYRHAQEALSITVPYVVLKGTSSAKYYLYPEFRIMGDIDIITLREDFDIAYQQFVELGYEIKKENERETGFAKDRIVVELHRSFAKLNDLRYAEYLDNLIIDSIDSSHELPDRINGLVLLEHISQHLVNGLGLRQIIDWMMFVNKCLSDDEWLEFSILAKNIGLEKLAVTVTRMCEIYLGLSAHAWCKSADESLCHQLMDYVLDCGNFGIKKESGWSYKENVFIYYKKPMTLFKLLQKRGVENWHASQRIPVLKPLAWFYQGLQYLKKGLSRRYSFGTLKTDYVDAQKRQKMFDALGVRQNSKGLVVYRNGKYVKE